MPRRLHHINFLVRDLEAAVRTFETTLSLGPFEKLEHPTRGSRIARAPLGDAWFVLVCPNDPDSVPGRHLAEHGEGFFLLSLTSPDLVADLARLAARGFLPADAVPREGLPGWKVADIGTLHGANFHLTQAGDTSD